MALKTPEHVAAAVVRAIERNRSEIDVAPLALRLGAAAAGLLPEPRGACSAASAPTRLAGDGGGPAREARAAPLVMAS